MIQSLKRKPPPQHNILIRITILYHLIHWKFNNFFYLIISLKCMNLFFSGRISKRRDINNEMFWNELNYWKRMNSPHSWIRISIILYSQFWGLVLLTADDGVPRPAAGLSADPGAVTEPDPAVLTFVLSDLPWRELRLVPGEDDGVGWQPREPALRGLCLC